MRITADAVISNLNNRNTVDFMFALKKKIKIKITQNHFFTKKD